MKTKYPDLYTDYLISTTGYATATELSPMLDGEISHDQVTRFLSERKYTSRNLWREVKSVVRQIEQEKGYLIFDESVQQKAWTDENEIVCWHYDYCKGRTVKGISLLNALYYNDEVLIPVAFEMGGQVAAIYEKRWKVEEFHKSLKSNAALAKSPTRMVITQWNQCLCPFTPYLNWNV
ncbi:DDE superfamily endonuclease [Nitrosomonas communis]|uniref:DDE superfamily endonuclease n=1 Tax=Nitrosomonas communis TaxID=44574 RepID=A0A1H2RNU4_9PROT|nr:DDE superfamily endonuclease [Nitrosomonas communis]